MNSRIGIAYLVLFALLFYMCGNNSNSAQGDHSGAANRAPVNATPTTVIDPTNMDVDLLIRLIAEGVNKEREANGISPLLQDENLMKAAKDKNDYQTYVGIPNEHQTETSVRSVVDKVNFYGGTYRLVGENSQFYAFPVQRLEGVFTLLAPEYHKAAEDIVAKWIATPDKRENIVNDAFTHAGTAIGWSEETNALFATQVFGGK